jgi:HEAT repeat protein
VSATLSQLVSVRSALVEELLAYLDYLARRMAELPAYYPEHLRKESNGRTLFDDIRQVVQVVEDRSAFERWLAQERERMRAAGYEFERIGYAPGRARPEIDEPAMVDQDLMGWMERPDRPERRRPPRLITWDEQAGRQFKRAMILGDPGFGKTWLLRYETRRIACEQNSKLAQRRASVDELTLPIFARLSDLNATDDPIEDALVRLASQSFEEALAELGLNRRLSQSFGELVRRKLENGLAVILMDAWDEVPVEVPPPGKPLQHLPHQRQRLARRLEAFARRFPQARLLMSSRIVGYTSLSIPELKELELLAFDWPQVELFARVWFGNETYYPEFPAKIRKRHQVRGLARIPLMLALLCRVYTQCEEDNRDFPSRRVELYHLALQGLIRDWKGGKQQREIDDGEVKYKLELLKAVSYSLFEEGYEQFSDSILEDKVAEWLAGLGSEDRYHGWKANALVDELKLDGILVNAGKPPGKRQNRRSTAENTGVNNAASESELMFLHRTFQEYLTASALKERAESEGWDSIARLVDKRAWLVEWSEVITLLAGQMADPVPLLKLLSDKRRDDYFRHRLCLASRCLPELQGEAASRSVTRISQQIADDVFKLWSEQECPSEYLDYKRRISFPHISRCLPSIARARSASVFSAVLNRLADRDERVRARAVAAYALGLMGEPAATPEVLRSLLAALGDGVGDWRVSMRAAEALGRMGKAAATPEGLRSLVAALGHQDEDVRVSAARAFGHLGKAAATPEVLRSLVAALGRQDEDVRVSAARTFGHLGKAAATPEVLRSLLAALGHKVSYVRRYAAYALGLMGKAAATPEVLRSLLAALGDQDCGVGSSAAKTLGLMGEAAATPEVLCSLLAALGHQREFVRVQAAEALGQMGEAAATPEVLRSLLAALGDGDGDPRVPGAAAKALGLMGEPAATPEALRSLLAALRHRNSVFMRWSAATALGLMGEPAATPEVLQSLVAALGDQSLVAALGDWESWVHRGAAKALGLMGKAAATPEVLRSLLAALRDRNSFFVRWSAAEALGQMGEAAATPEVLRSLLAALGDQREFVRGCAAEALGQMGEAAATPEVLQSLVAALGDQESWVRRRAAEALGRMGKAAATPEVFQSLLAALRDQEWEVGSSAAEALGRMGEAAATPEVLHSLLAVLGGLDSDLRWSAAMALSRIMAEGTRVFRYKLSPLQCRTVSELSR